MATPKATPTDPDDEVTEAELLAPGTDLAIQSSSAEVATYLASQAAIDEEDPESTAFEIVNRILQARTPEEVLRRQQVLSAEDVLMTPLILGRVRWHRSDYDGREGAYALLEAANVNTGEPLLITCGGRTVMAQVWQLDRLGALPCRVQFGKASKATRSGYFPLWLEPAPK